MAAIIYLLTNTINGKQYVGQTTSGLNVRWNAHCGEVKRGSNCRIHKAIRKYGTDAFVREILEEVDEESINLREIHWISQLNPVYNMTKGGEGMRGWSPNEETRAKQSYAKKGKKLSLETRKKLSIARSGERNFWYGKGYLRVGENGSNYGNRHSEETKAKIGAASRKRTMGKDNPFYGKKHSEETKVKISAKAKLRSRMRRIVAPTVTLCITLPL